MRYFLRTTLGLVLMIGAIVAISYAVNQLLQVGTCASGGPYLVARECPSGIERLMLAIPAGTFALLGGAGIYALRGNPPGADRPDGSSAIIFVWSGLFLGIAFACFWGVWGPDANPGPGGKTGGLIVGFLFVPIGVLGLIPMLSAAKAGRAATQASGIGAADAWRIARAARRADMGELIQEFQEHVAPGSASDSGTTSTLRSLEVLQELREQGAIDEAEFQRLKRKVMGA